jgi:hypothetical protein
MPKVTHDDLIDCIERLTNAIYTLVNSPSDIRPVYDEVKTARAMIRKMRGQYDDCRAVHGPVGACDKCAIKSSLLPCARHDKFDENCVFCAETNDESVT